MTLQLLSYLTIAVLLASAARAEDVLTKTDLPLPPPLELGSPRDKAEAPRNNAAAAVVAAVLGPLLFRLDGPYFAIGSWVAAEALRLICAQFKSLGGGTGMSISPSELSQMVGLKAVQALLGLRPAAARDVLVYWLALLLAVLVTLGIYGFMRSHHGLALAASRDNAAAARSVGAYSAAIATGASGSCALVR